MTFSSSPHLVVRAEARAGDRRVALVPSDAGELVRAGFRVSVEACAELCFSASDFARAGCTIVAAGFWKVAPLDAFILGIGELPEESAGLAHRHLCFASSLHSARRSSALLERFARGGGLLLDLESLSSRKAGPSFSFFDGFLGAALGLLGVYGHRLNVPLAPFASSRALLAQVEMARALAEPHVVPRVIVGGPASPAVEGALEVLGQLGFVARRLSDGGGPFAQILDFDLYLHAASADASVGPYLTPSLLHQSRRLSHIVDICCHSQRPHNCLPIYREPTSFARPWRRLRSEPSLELLAIEPLSALLPKESSVLFSGQLLPHLLALADGSEAWRRAERFYWQRRDPARLVVRGGTVT